MRFDQPELDRIGEEAFADEVLKANGEPNVSEMVRQLVQEALKARERRRRRRARAAVGA